MPYAVKTFTAPDAAVILCKDDRELAEVSAKTVCGLALRRSYTMNFGIECAIWVASDALTFSRFPIPIYRLTEEEYEKWQKAF